MQATKIIYLEGLRGIAALAVLFHHLRDAFLYYLGNSSEKLFIAFFDQTSSKRLASIFNLLSDGKFAVHIFWILSAYVISIKLFSVDIIKSNQIVFLSSIKRYFRLVLPCLASVLIAYTILSFGYMNNIPLSIKLNKLYFNDWLGEFYNFEPNFLLAIKSGLWDTFFNYSGKDSYNANLWTMSFELWGSLFCFCIYGIFMRVQSRYICYIVISVLCILLQKDWLLCFIMGYWLADIDYSPEPAILKDTIKKMEAIIITMPFILLLIFIIVIVFNYSIFSFLQGRAVILLSFCVVYLIHRTSYLNTFLSKRVFAWLGKISFSLYLLHIPILCSIGALTYNYFYNNSITAITMGSLATITCTLIAAHFFEKIIDRPAVTISNKIAQQILNLK